MAGAPVIDRNKSTPSLPILLLWLTASRCLWHQTPKLLDTFLLPRLNSTFLVRYIYSQIHSEIIFPTARLLHGTSRWCSWTCWVSFEGQEKRWFSLRRNPSGRLDVIDMVKSHNPIELTKVSCFESVMVPL